ncbi:response regulator [Pleurocapsales cyanobacterium LEGE 10410]|nr:response regulator [Pleurocapsales cyanobacterium LEGE 10410]
MRILLIDDDEQLMEVLASKLIEQRYAVDIANTGEMGWEFILLFSYDLVVLDWMLPDIDGVELCQQIRAEDYKMPIMLLTARDRYTDKVMGLDAGADDYVVKPFNFDVLTAKIRALLRREINVGSPVLKWHDLSLDPKIHEVKYQNKTLPLTPKEYGLIELFMRHPQQVFSPGAIIDNLWAGEDPPGEEAVRTHIKGLRQKLKTAGLDKDTIKTVYGVGYCLKAHEEGNASKSNRSSRQVAVNKNWETKPSRQDQLKTVTRVWSKFKDLAFQRLADLENLVVALVEAQVTEELQTQAKNSAHKLAGSLGCFGFPEGSKIARQIEKMLWNQPIKQADIEQIIKLTKSLHGCLQHQPFEETVKEALGKNISLLIVDRNRNSKLSQQLDTQAQQNGIKTYPVFEPAQAQEILEQESLTAVLYNIAFPDGEDLKFLEQLHRQKPHLPIVVLAKSAQLLDRLELVRKGSNLILEHPIEASIVISSVTELIESLGAQAKVLIVDDDPQVLLSLEISLKPWGFELATLEHASELWNVLEDFEPDILVLDIEMPDINGIELCQVLRSDRRWQHLPVLFLSVHQDEKTQYQAFAIGADDYICKPVTGSMLANRILNRLQRSRITHT